jgi:hypothetical protein
MVVAQVATSTTSLRSAIAGLRWFDTAVVVVVALSNNIDERRPLVLQALEAFATAKHRAVTMVGS